MTILDKHSNNTPPILFCHIEKTGGTTLNGALRTFNGFRYAHGRALLHNAPTSSRALHADDLKLYLKLAPWLRCISGHAIRPWVLLDEGVTNHPFLGILRDPITRYVSYYTYGGGDGKRKPWPYTFEEYLEKEEFHNYQTKRIAGIADTAKAMDIIENHYWSIALLEQFDEMVLKIDEIWSGISNCYARSGHLNKRKDNKRVEILRQYREEIIERNLADIDLCNTLKEKYNGCYVNQTIHKSIEPVSYQDKTGYDLKINEIKAVLLRRAYFTPISKGVRIFHGLPASGVY